MERNTTIKFETSPQFTTESFSFTIHFEMLRNWKSCYENNTNKKREILALKLMLMKDDQQEIC